MVSQQAPDMMVPSLWLSKVTSQKARHKIRPRVATGTTRFGRRSVSPAVTNKSADESSRNPNPRSRKESSACQPTTLDPKDGLMADSSFDGPTDFLPGTVLTSTLPPDLKENPKGKPPVLESPQFKTRLTCEIPSKRDSWWRYQTHPGVDRSILKPLGAGRSRGGNTHASHQMAKLRFLRLHGHRAGQLWTTTSGRTLLGMEQKSRNWGSEWRESLHKPLPCGGCGR